MTAHAGAPSTQWTQWSDIVWSTIATFVHRLQVRIAKAVAQQRWGKVRALQHLLCRSFYARLWAVRRVISNKGKRSPGVDGVIWRSNSQRWGAAQKLKHRGYKPSPLRRIYIPKANGKQRPLGIPTMADRAMQALHALALSPVSEATADPNSYGFRPYRSTADAIGQCFVILAKSQSPQWILEADIEACFDQISHQWLIQNIPMDKSILQAWLKAGYMHEGRYFDTLNGTPQGGIASPILANMALDGLEEAVAAAVPKRGAKVNVVRFADDFIITGVSKEILTDYVLPKVNAFLAERGLRLSQSKTQITPIAQGFNFLGFNLRKYGSKLLIKPSVKNIRRCLDTIKTQITRMQGAPGEALVGELNLRLRGFFHYYRHVVSKVTFQRIDDHLYFYLKIWAKKRHRKKTWAWVKRRYFIAPSGLWHFSITKKTQGTQKRYALFRLQDLPIRRHIKVRGKAHAYAADNAKYFAQRRKQTQQFRQQDQMFLRNRQVATFRGNH